MKNIFMVVLSGYLLLWRGSNSQLINPDLAKLLNDSSWSDVGNLIQKQLRETELRADIGSLFHGLFAALKSSSFPTAVATNISQQCNDDSQAYVHDLYLNQSLWALRMQESSGQMPPGLYGSANFHADGLFDECLAIRAPNFDGQYCTVAFWLETVDPSEIIPAQKEYLLGRRNPLAIFQLLGLLSGSDRVKPKLAGADPTTYILPSISFCLPSSCSAADLGQAVAQLFGGYIVANNSLVTITDEQYCFKENKNPVQLDGAEIAVIVTLTLLGFFVVSATIHEGWRMYFDIPFEREKDGKLISYLHCFSALNNGRKILSMRVSVSSGSDNLGCIHGIRFFSTCWVVLGHTWTLSLYKTMNPRALKNDALNWGMQTIANGSISVDTFFLMSGLLVSYLLLRELDRSKGRFNIGLFYLHRYLRLTPVYAILLGFIATLMVYVGTGPNWYSVILASNGCRLIWWRQFLYINNLFPSDPSLQCMGQTWYLAVDMQLFLVAPLVIYPLWRWRKYGLAWLALIGLLCQVSIFAIYAVYDLMPTMIVTRFGDLASSDIYFDKYYVKPWTRAPPYLVGVWMGWYLHTTKNKPNRLSKIVVVLGWMLSTVVGLAVLYGMSPYLDPSQVPEIDPAVKMTYGPLHRTAWGMVIAWIIYACSRGYGGFVNRFLSWKGFLPLGRLTYCVYLIHYDFLNVFFAANRKQYYYTMLGEFTTSFGIIVISFGMAFVASVTLEASFLNLEKLVFSSKQKSKIQNEDNLPKADDKIKC